MNYSIVLSPNFKKEAKRLIKKYSSLKEELANLITSLEQKPEQGVSLGNGLFKIRIGITSKGKGKSGGARVISYVQVLKTEVLLLTIYDKSERGNITDKEIRNILNG